MDESLLFISCLKRQVGGINSCSFGRINLPPDSHFYTQEYKMNFEGKKLIDSISDIDRNFIKFCTLHPSSKL